MSSIFRDRANNYYLELEEIKDLSSLGHLEEFISSPLSREMRRSICLNLVISIFLCQSLFIYLLGTKRSTLTTDPAVILTSSDSANSWVDPSSERSWPDFAVWGVSRVMVETGLEESELLLGSWEWYTSLLISRSFCGTVKATSLGTLVTNIR